MAYAPPTPISIGKKVNSQSGTSPAKRHAAAAGA